MRLSKVNQVHRKREWREQILKFRVGLKRGFGERWQFLRGAGGGEGIQVLFTIKT